MITEKDEEIWRDEIARHVRHLSRAVHEITFWMAEVEKTGLLPEGLSRRALSRSQLQRLEQRIKSVQDTLESVTQPHSGMPYLHRETLKDSLAVLQDKADNLRRSLPDA